MIVKVVLPRQFIATKIFEEVDRHFGNFQEIPSKVDFDFRQLQFVRPSGVVFLSNLTKYLVRNGCEVTFCGMSKRTLAIEFLDDSLFFEQHLGKKLNSSCSPRSTTLPLIEIQHSDSHSWIRSTFIPWLSDCTSIAPHDLGELATCLGELFNNIDDHTELDVGSVFAQWYPQEERIIVAIADFGVGIPSTVSRVCAGLSDNDAIMKAFEDEFTSRSTPRNRGAGLFFLLQNVVQNLGGKLEVNSARGSLKFEKDRNSYSVVPYARRGFCPGTMIVLEFSSAEIERTEGDLEDIEW